MRGLCKILFAIFMLPVFVFSALALTLLAVVTWCNEKSLSDDAPPDDKPISGS
jgi:hypothetical protein